MLRELNENEMMMVSGGDTDVSDTAIVTGGTAAGAYLGASRGRLGGAVGSVFGAMVGATLANTTWTDVAIFWSTSSVGSAVNEVYTNRYEILDAYTQYITDGS